MLRTSGKQKKPISGSVKSMKQADKVSQRELEIADQLFHSKYEDLGERERKLHTIWPKGPLSRGTRLKSLLTIQQDQLRLLGELIDGLQNRQ